MNSSDSGTCWTEIREAGRGEEASRERFVQRYEPLVRGYLRARWPGASFDDQREDAIQEVFLECFREGGVLERVDDGRPRGFRAFFRAVVLNIARRHEERFARRHDGPTPESFDLDDIARREATLSQMFDRAWAETIVREAALLQRERATEEAAKRRVELLRLRFEEGLPIREIASSWDEKPARLHHEYAQARSDFEKVLVEVLRFHHPEAPGKVPEEARQLLQLLQPE